MYHPDAMDVYNVCSKLSKVYYTKRAVRRKNQLMVIYYYFTENLTDGDFLDIFYYRTTRACPTQTQFSYFTGLS